ncbi:MAG: HEPN domain-containing protein [Gemmatimonadetes bacterium]|nr:HEPN domain-containing protein [Gemmatimonadota bacterium]MDE2736399.1 HEPN domain-containing protein [Gemmatimonadota bacterium]
MNPPERFPPDDPREWLNRAKSSFAMAKNRVPDAYLEDLCFGAQQAAEKAIKAVMISRNIDFPYVHDLALLLSILEKDGENVPDEVRRATILTPYAVDIRYPSIEQPVSEQDYRDAIEIAEAVIQWATDRLSPELGNSQPDKGL